ncbi:MAG: 16S rRNA (cytosine(1402)-N(4))-methyltransferase RsmH [bacterium]|nr:16S rRNA (cytosine(1402)-N(4))-methyltransferase RsmH [bacterium]
MTEESVPLSNPLHTHQPVMLKEVLETLDAKKEGIYVDGTFGVGGYTQGILEANPKNHVIAIDRDPEAIKRSENLKNKYGDRLTFCSGCFGEMDALVAQALGQGQKVQGVCLDLGVSSPQLDQAERGFSFRFEGPLDMRMNPEGVDPSAADIVASKDEKELSDIFWQLGQERYSRRVAKKIIEIRAESPIETTQQLAEIIRSVVPKEWRKGKGVSSIDPATRVFQALRLYVNDELGELERGLSAAESILGTDGRFVVVSFHSLEDRLVKRFLRDRSGVKKGVSRHLPQHHSETAEDPTFDIPFRKALRPEEGERKTNPRSRSARLRLGIRTQAPLDEKGEGS